MQERLSLNLRFVRTMLGCAVLLIAARSAVFAADTSVITTFAGGNPAAAGGLSGDNGPATSAYLQGPEAVYVDPNGNVFIADSGEDRVRKVGTNGIITTVAGWWPYPFGGDGGPATSATLNQPVGIVTDASGNLYIADYGNHRVRRVDAATGIIDTYAGNGTPAYAGDGGPATGASLNHPVSLAFDSGGNLLIADSGNNCIRRVDSASGIITTIAGNGVSTFAGDGGPATAASFSNPVGIAVDHAGNAFIVDQWNFRIRRIDGVSGIISTVAGNGLASFSGDGGPALNAAFNYPTGIAVDLAGNLFVVDGLNYRTRRVDAFSRIITTVAGTGSYLESGDGGPATSAGLDLPVGIAVDSTGGIYIAELASSRVRRVTYPPTSLALTSDNNPATIGDLVTFTASISPPTATGSIQFFDGANFLGAAQLSNGQTSFTSQSLTAGSHTITALYGGDSSDAPSVSAPLTQAIRVFVSSAAISPYTGPLTYGPATFTVSIVPISATGTIQMFEGAQLVSSATLSGGSASLPVSVVTVGTHYYTFVYSGDNQFVNFTVGPFHYTVYPASTVTSLSATPATVAIGDPITLKATVTPSTATGSIQFIDGSTVVATVALSAGSAVATVTAASAGLHLYHAQFSGDANYSGSGSFGVWVTVQAPSTTTSLQASQTSLTFGQSVTLTASVTPALAAGTVTFADYGMVIGNVALINGTASMTSILSAGGHSIQATFDGSTSYAASTSSAVAVIVTKATTTTTLSSSANPGSSRSPVTYTARISSSLAAGTVQFFDGTTLLSTVPASNGSASLSWSLASGSHVVGAVYSGDTNLNGSSATLKETIKK